MTILNRYEKNDLFWSFFCFRQFEPDYCSETGFIGYYKKFVYAPIGGPSGARTKCEGSKT